MGTKARPKSYFTKFRLSWTKPNIIAASVNIRRLQQGGLSLPKYIEKATVLCEQSENPPKVRDRLPREGLVIGSHFSEPYYKCIDEDLGLPLEEGIAISQERLMTPQRTSLALGLHYLAQGRFNADRYDKQGSRPKRQ